MNRRDRGFTLTEVLVVMGIIILFLTMALPTIRTLTGSRSIGVAQNELAAIITRVREEAIAVQDYRGVLFYLDPSNDRVIAIIVQTAAIQDPIQPAFTLLDAEPNRESLTLPLGVRVQTIFNGVSTSLTSANEATASANRQDDRYLGFNAIKGSNLAPTSGSSIQIQVGGCILFDGNGRLASIPYGFQMAAVSGNSTGPSTLCQLFGFASVSAAAATADAGNKSSTVEFIPGSQNNSIPTAPVYSQLGVVAFDRDTFISQQFTDADSDFVSGQGYTAMWQNPYGQSEQAEEAWLDQNSTPLLINRFDGTLIRSE